MARINHHKMIPLLGLVLASGLSTAQADLIDFNSLAHGEIVNTQFQGSHGLIISGDNPNQSYELVVAFDTTRTGTADPDLEDPWTVGNLAPNTYLGNILVVAELGLYDGHEGILEGPDDEAGGGSIIFDFKSDIMSFGFDLVDIEPNELGEVTFYHDNAQVGSVGFSEFIDSNSMFYDGTIVFGDNSANRIAPILASDLNATAFDHVEILLAGSGGVDNLMMRHTPAPGAALLGLLGIGLIGGRRRRTVAVKS